MANKIQTEIALEVSGDGKVNAAVGKVGATISDASGVVDKLKRNLSTLNVAAKLSAITNSLSLIKSTVGFVGGAASKAFGFLDSYASAADKMSKFSRSVGMGVEDLQKWQYAARRGGVANEAFNQSLVKFENSISRAANGEKQYLSAFNALGVRVKDSNGNLRGTSAIMLDLADAYSKVTNAQDKIAINQQLFGRGGTGLLNVLEGGSVGVSALLKQREDLGGLITDKEAKQAEEFKDQLENVQTLVGGIGKSIAARLLPNVSKLFDKILGWWKNNSSKFMQGVDRFGNSAVAMVESIIDKLPALLDGATWLVDKFTMLVDTIGLGKASLLALTPIVAGPLLSSVTGLLTAFGGCNTSMGGLLANIKGAPGMIGLVTTGILAWGSAFNSFRENWDLWKNTSLKEVVDAMGLIVMEFAGLDKSVEKAYSPIKDALASPEAKAEIDMLYKDWMKGGDKFDRYGSAPNSTPKIFIDFKNVPRGVSVEANSDFNKSPADMSVGYAFDAGI